MKAAFNLCLAGLMVASTTAGPSLWSLVENFELPLSKSIATKGRLLEFGDYAEIPESCPATTTCPVICVKNLTDCPTECEDPGLSLCADGTCAENCDNSLETPCLCDDLPLACPKVINFYDECKIEYDDYYSNDVKCQEAQEEAIPQADFIGPIFVFLYIYIATVTFIVWLWCLFNQVISPVEASTLPMSSHAGESDAGWTQTGYKVHGLGQFVHFLVQLTLYGFQFLLLMLTIFYYMQQEAITRWDPVFLDEVQVLLAFEIVWMVGFFWSFAFKFPCSMDALFLRRCRVDEATHIAVNSPVKVVRIDESLPLYGEQVFAMLVLPFDKFLRFFFSYQYGRTGESVIFCKIEKDNLSSTCSFYHRMRRYVFNEEDKKYIPGGMDIGKTFGDFLNQKGGLTNDRAAELAGLVGPNIIPLEKPTIIGSIMTEFSKPFYLYQNYMVWTWAPYWYYYMAIVQTAIRLTGGIVVSVINYIGRKNLYRITHVEGKVELLREGEYVTVDVRNIVPGDIVKLKNGHVHCDLVVVQGEHIIVDESALTGEANTKPKYELDATAKETVFDPKHHSVHAISAGTTIIEVGDGNELGLVTKTGSFTVKGELLSDVLSYARHKFKFDDEVKIVIFILILEAIILFSLTVYFLKDQWVYSWFYGMFIVGTVIPPLLPTVFVVSVGVSAKRLQNKHITCTYPEGILIAGKVKDAFFDKTGTLTKQGMEFISADSSDHEDKLKIGMAVCHTLKTSSAKVLIGNQVDKATFNSTGAQMEYSAGQKIKIVHEGSPFTVLKRYEFDSHRATQSVVVQDSSGRKQVFVKGSPEAIRKLCVGESVPDSIDETIRDASKSGVYQLVIAFRGFEETWDISDVKRDNIESSLTFGGFVNFRNALQDATPAVVSELLAGDITCAIVTGDSVFTGIYVARESGIISEGRQVIVGSRVLDDTIEWVDAETDEKTDGPAIDSADTFPDEDNASEKQVNECDFALSGEVWRHIRETQPKFAALISRKVKVFGRCNPSDKVSVIESFVESGSKTLMVGDGQNDCGALKMAHVGIALSSSEASIVAPFTSLDKTITATTDVLREGRCALASALAAYKYYITYGQVESYLQAINAYLSISFTEWCWVFLDGIWSFTMAFSLPLAKAAKNLAPQRPTASLLGPHTMSSICGILSLNILFICIGLLALWNQDWFQCRMWDSNDVSNVLTIGDNYESTVLFAIGGFQYIASAMALNFGYVFRQHYLKNYIFVFFSTLWVVFQLVMVVHPSGFSCIWRVNCDNEDAVRWVTSLEPVAINNPFNTTVMPVRFRWILFVIMVANLFALMGWEYFVINGSLGKRFNSVVLPNRNVRKVESV